MLREPPLADIETSFEFRGSVGAALAGELGEEESSISPVVDNELSLPFLPPAATGSCGKAGKMEVLLFVVASEGKA